MTIESVLRDRLSSLLVKELQDRVAEATQRLPHRCVHNHRQPLDTRKRVGGTQNPHYNRTSQGNSLPVLQSIGFCMLGSENPEGWAGTICEEPLDAKRCGVFEALETKAQIYEKFRAEINDPAWLHVNMPDVAELIVLLRLAEMPPLPWWARLWFWLKRIPLESVAPPFDLAKSLPALEQDSK